MALAMIDQCACQRDEGLRPPRAGPPWRREKQGKSGIASRLFLQGPRLADMSLLETQEREVGRQQIFRDRGELGDAPEMTQDEALDFLRLAVRPSVGCLRQSWDNSARPARPARFSPALLLVERQTRKLGLSIRNSTTADGRRGVRSLGDLRDPGSQPHHRGSVGAAPSPEQPAMRLRPYGRPKSSRGQRRGTPSLTLGRHVAARTPK